VAEDNEINQIVIQRQLEALGHDITVVENGAAAMR
jgi:CheY-like chemotaxis protein